MTRAPLLRAHPGRPSVVALWVLTGLAACPCWLCEPSTVRAAAPDTCLPLDRAEADAIDPDLWATLARWLDASGTALVEGPAPTRCTALRPVTLTSTPTGARVEVADVQGRVDAVREVLRGDSAAVFRETVAQVVLSVVAPAVQAAAPSEPPASVPPVPLPVSVPSRPVRMSASLGAGTTWLLAGELRAAFGGGVGARFAGRRTQPLIELSTRGLTRTPVERAGVRGSLRGAQLRAWLGLALVHRSGWGLDAGPSMGLDVMRLDLGDPGAAVAIVDTGRSLGPVAGLSWPRKSGPSRL